MDRKKQSSSVSIGSNKKKRPQGSCKDLTTNSSLVVNARTVNIPTTVVGDWSKPAYLEIPDYRRASKSGRLYVPNEFNEFLERLGNLKNDECKTYNHDFINATKEVKLYEINADNYPVCVLPERHAEKLCDYLGLSCHNAVEKLKQTLSSDVFLRAQSRLSSASVTSVNRSSVSSRRSAVLSNSHALLLQPSFKKTRSSVNKTIPPFVLSTDVRDNPLYRDHHNIFGEISPRLMSYRASYSQQVVEPLAKQREFLPSLVVESPSLTSDLTEAIILGPLPSHGQQSVAVSEKSDHSTSPVHTPKIPLNGSNFLRSKLPPTLKRTYNLALYNCINEQINCGVSVANNGFLLQETPVYYFCRHIKGIDFKNLSYRVSCAGAKQLYVPVIVEKLEADCPGFLAEDWSEAQKMSSVPIKACIPGPYSILHSVATSRYSMYLLQDIINIIAIEIQLLYQRGCKHIQIDEPSLTEMAEESTLSELVGFMRRITSCFDKVPWRFSGSLDWENSSTVKTYFNFNPFQEAPQDPCKVCDLNTLLGTLMEATERAGFFAVCVQDIPNIDLKTFLLTRRIVIVLGCTDSYDLNIESVYKIRQRLLEVLLYIPPERLMISPTSGLGYLDEATGMRKLLNMATASKGLSVPLNNYYKSCETGKIQYSSGRSSRNKQSKRITGGSKAAKMGSHSPEPALYQKSSRTSRLSADLKSTESTASIANLKTDDSLLEASYYNTGGKISKLSFQTQNREDSEDFILPKTGPSEDDLPVDGTNADINQDALADKKNEIEPGALFEAEDANVSDADFVKSFWHLSGIPENIGGLQQMLVKLSERLMKATPRTAYTNKKRLKPSHLTRFFKRWPDVQLSNKSVVESLAFDINIGSPEGFKQYDAINISTESIGIPKNEANPYERIQHYPIPPETSQFYAKCQKVYDLYQTSDVERSQENKIKEGGIYLKILSYKFANPKLAKDKKLVKGFYGIVKGVLMKSKIHDKGVRTRAIKDSRFQNSILKITAATEPSPYLFPSDTEPSVEVSISKISKEDISNAALNRSKDNLFSENMVKRRQSYMNLHRDSTDNIAKSESRSSDVSITACPQPRRNLSKLILTACSSMDTTLAKKESSGSANFEVPEVPTENSIVPKVPVICVTQSNTSTTVCSNKTCCTQVHSGKTSKRGSKVEIKELLTTSPSKTNSQNSQMPITSQMPLTQTISKSFTTTKPSLHTIPSASRTNTTVISLRESSLSVKEVYDPRVRNKRMSTHMWKSSFTKSPEASLVTFDASNNKNPSLETLKSNNPVNPLSDSRVLKDRQRNEAKIPSSEKPDKPIYHKKSASVLQGIINAKQKNGAKAITAEKPEKKPVLEFQQYSKSDLGQFVVQSISIQSSSLRIVKRGEPHNLEPAKSDRSASLLRKLQAPKHVNIFRSSEDFAVSQSHESDPECVQNKQSDGAYSLPDPWRQQLKKGQPNQLSQPSKPDVLKQEDKLPMVYLDSERRASKSIQNLSALKQSKSIVLKKTHSGQS